jgi:hypothetical protein
MVRLSELAEHLGFAPIELACQLKRMAGSADPGELLGAGQLDPDFFTSPEETVRADPDLSDLAGRRLAQLYTPPAAPSTS